MTILALFRREEWLYIETADRKCGYVPLDTCKPIAGRPSALDYDKTLVNNKTSVSLLDVTIDQPNANEKRFTSMDENNMYLHKMKHFFRSLDPIEKYDNDIDSGFSDCDSTNHNFMITTTTTIQNTRETGPIKRAGIKTNGSIPITSNININIQHSIQGDQKFNDIRIDNKTKIRNLSTIIEQSCNSICHSKHNLSIEKRRDVLADADYKKTSLINLNSNDSRLTFETNSLNVEVNSCMRQVNIDYEPEFVDDLKVRKGEQVTLLDDENSEWIYVISEVGKGFIPRSCIE
jgi:hypothetical protein